jgi:hypothetical protein
MTKNQPQGKELALQTLAELHSELSGENDWENTSLDRYIEALGALLESIENHYINTKQPIPSDPWVLISDALRGARYYE